jgi:exopolyphosphatase/pppGpp-phosphohydrolase
MLHLQIFEFTVTHTLTRVITKCTSQTHTLTITHTLIAANLHAFSQNVSLKHSRTHTYTFLRLLLTPNYNSTHCIVIPALLLWSKVRNRTALSSNPLHSKPISWASSQSFICFYPLVLSEVEILKVEQRDADTVTRIREGADTRRVRKVKIHHA